MTLQIRMADSVQPWQIPHLYATRPNGVAVYRDGPYAWNTGELTAYPWQWGITVTANPKIAPHARVIDVEHLDATPQHVQPYQRLRATLGEQTTVYCSRDTVPGVVAADEDWHDLLWWIATLDGQPWDPDLIVAWIKSHYTITLDPAKIAAIQNMPMGYYDSSLVFGDPEWLHYAA